MEKNQIEHSIINISHFPVDEVNKSKQIIELEAKIQDLRDLCDNLNPYDEIDINAKNRLAKHNIYDLYDPFTITNKLLVCLEDAIEELYQIKQIPLE